MPAGQSQQAAHGCRSTAVQPGTMTVLQVVRLLAGGCGGGRGGAAGKGGSTPVAPRRNGRQQQSGCTRAAAAGRPRAACRASVASSFYLNRWRDSCATRSKQHKGSRLQGQQQQQQTRLMPAMTSLGPDSVLAAQTRIVWRPMGARCDRAGRTVVPRSEEDAQPTCMISSTIRSDGGGCERNEGRNRAYKAHAARCIDAWLLGPPPSPPSIFVF